MFIFSPLHPGYMTTSGSSLLRLIQNDEMNLYDLLVRESVQNSLDAGLSKTAMVTVEYNFLECPSETICRMLPELGERFLDRQATRRRMLEIRDTGTTGLTGDVGGWSRERGQNLIKLVFEISKSHDDPNGTAETGGSWGLGKTVYYRMGAGLVFYYSRVMIGKDQYQERMVACMVENEKLNQRFITQSETGIAWWGGEHVKGQDGRSWPAAVTDSLVIGEALSALGVLPFTGEETGTAVLIPFLDNELLPRVGTVVQDIMDEDDFAEGLRFVYDRWYGDDAGYVETALYRWYAVRLDNHAYPYGGALRAKVNGRDIGSGMPTFYKAVQLLYNMASGVGLTGDGDFSGGKGNENRFARAISINGTFAAETEAGCVAAIRLRPEELGMGAPDNEHSPFVQLFNKECSEPFVPIIGYLRTPGMIVRWNDAEWVNSVRPDTDGRIIIALFVPHSTQQFRPEVIRSIDKDIEIRNLEQYLRLVEKADHSQWRDRERSGLTIIDRIRKGCLRVISEKFGDLGLAADSQVDLALARYLADAFLPQGFGQDSRIIITEPPPDPKVPRKRKPTLVVERTEFEGNVIVVDWILHWGKEGRKAQNLVVSVGTESGEITIDQWRKDCMPGEFPFDLHSACVTKIISSNSRGRNPGIDLAVGTGTVEDSNDLLLLRKESAAVLLECILDDGIEGWILQGQLRIMRRKGFEDFCAHLGLVGKLELDEDGA